MNIKQFFGVKSTNAKKNDEKPKIEPLGYKEPIGHEEPTDEPDEPVDKPKFMIGKYNLYNMILKKQKKNYQILVKYFGKPDKIRFKLSWLKSPFGVEQYAHKEIVNLEFVNHLKNNISHNNYAVFKQLDDMLGKLNTKVTEIDNFIYLTADQLNALKGLYYSPLIKSRPNDFDPLVRLHLKKVKDTIATKCYKKVNDKLEEISVFEIKGHMVEVDLELSSLWVSNDSFGVVIVINRIVVIGN